MFEMIGNVLSAFGRHLLRVSRENAGYIATNTTSNSGFQTNMDSSSYRVTVQVQDSTGMWRNTAHTYNDPQIYMTRMQEASNIYPGKRVRAIDENNRVVDIF